MDGLVRTVVTDGTQPPAHPPVPWLKNVLRIDDDLSLLAQFLILRMHELLECQRCLLPFLLEQFLAILRLACHIRLHISRLAFHPLDNKLPHAVMRSARVAHLQPKSHTAEVNLLSKLGDGVTTFQQARLHHLYGQSSSQVSQRRARPYLGGPILRLLLGQFVTFLESQLLGDALLHGTEFLNHSWVDRCSL